MNRFARETSAIKSLAGICMRMSAISRVAAPTLVCPRGMKKPNGEECGDSFSFRYTYRIRAKRMMRE
ncbi:hypothetical protein E2C01_069768 [Portunus trituberculatus]|uniref:Uncharacterized protein n=1 Tax=Portunus trituberculatus TaxID=210409 RepID=A0A5B7HVF8_PORTR|nr:hypothetical protein [Portunus trituberculatus]